MVIIEVGISMISGILIGYLYSKFLTKFRKLPYVILGCIAMILFFLSFLFNLNLDFLEYFATFGIFFFSYLAFYSKKNKSHLMQ